MAKPFVDLKVRYHIERCNHDGTKTRVASCPPDVPEEVAVNHFIEWTNRKGLPTMEYLLVRVMHVEAERLDTILSHVSEP